MKVMLLGIAIILFVIALNNSGEAGFVISLIGLSVAIIGFFIKDKNRKNY